MAVSKDELLEGERAEVDELVAQDLDVALGERARLVEQAGGVGAAALGGGLAGRPEDHVQADQLLDRAVVDGRRDAAAHLRLGLDGAARQAARAQAAGRLRGAQAADHEPGGDRRDHEDGLVERVHVAGERGVAAQGRGEHEHGRAERGDHHAAALPLEDRVRRDQEHGRDADGAVRVGHGQLECEQDEQVDGGDERAEQALGGARGTGTGRGAPTGGRARPRPRRRAPRRESRGRAGPPARRR